MMRELQQMLVDQFQEFGTLNKLLMIATLVLAIMLSPFFAMWLYLLARMSFTICLWLLGKTIAACRSPFSHWSKPLTTIANALEITMVNLSFRWGAYSSVDETKQLNAACQESGVGQVESKSQMNLFVDMIHVVGCVSMSAYCMQLLASRQLFLVTSWLTISAFCITAQGLIGARALFLRRQIEDDAEQANRVLRAYDQSVLAFNPWLAKKLGRWSRNSIVDIALICMGARIASYLVPWVLVWPGFYLAYLLRIWMYLQPDLRPWLGQCYHVMTEKVWLGNNGIKYPLQSRAQGLVLCVKSLRKMIEPKDWLKLIFLYIGLYQVVGIELPMMTVSWVGPMLWVLSLIFLDKQMIMTTLRFFWLLLAGPVLILILGRLDEEPERRLLTSLCQLFHVQSPETIKKVDRIFSQFMMACVALTILYMWTPGHHFVGSHPGMAAKIYALHETARWIFLGITTKVLIDSVALWLANVLRSKGVDEQLCRPIENGMSLAALIAVCGSGSELVSRSLASKFGYVAGKLCYYSGVSWLWSTLGNLCRALGISKLYRHVVHKARQWSLTPPIEWVASWFTRHTLNQILLIVTACACSICLLWSWEKIRSIPVKKWLRLTSKTLKPYINILLAISLVVFPVSVVWSAAKIATAASAGVSIPWMMMLTIGHVAALFVFAKGIQLLNHITQDIERMRVEKFGKDDEDDELTSDEIPVAQPVPSAPPYAAASAPQDPYASASAPQDPYAGATAPQKSMWDWFRG